MEKGPEQINPEEQTKIEKERTISDAELLKKGADYIVDKDGNKKLEITNEQIETLKEGYSFNVGSLDAIKNSIEGLIHQTQSVEDIQEQLEEISDFKNSIIIDHNGNWTGGTIPYKIEQLEFAKNILSNLVKHKEFISSLNNAKKQELIHNLKDVLNESPWSARIKRIGRTGLVKDDGKNEPMRVARIHEKLGDKEIAEDMYKESAQTYEDFKSWMAVEAYEKLGNKEKVREIYEKFAKKGADSSYIMEISDAAEIYEKLGDKEKTRNAYEKIVQEYGNTYDYRDAICVAKAYEKLGNKEKAKEMYDRVVEDANDSSRFQSKQNYKIAAEAYEKLGNKEKTKEMYQMVLKEEKKDVKTQGSGFLYWPAVAKAYEKLGNKEKAKEAYEKYIKGLEDTPIMLTGGVYAHRLAAKIHEKLGHKEEDIENSYIESAEIAESENEYADTMESYEMLTLFHQRNKIKKILEDLK